MSQYVIRVAIVACLTLLVAGRAIAGEPSIHIDMPLPPPAWALLERELLKQNAAACEEFYATYFDERGFLLCVERWGGDDGPDDAIENCNDWPLLYLLGAPERVRTLYEQAWEGHLRQYTLAKTTDVPMAKDGMYYKEFPTQMDWMHNGEGLTVFNLTGLCDPANAAFQQRTRRYAGFYMNEDPQAPNYDPKVKIIRSLFNGSRGPLMRKATALDWAGDPIEVEGRFLPRHGERTYQEMLDHFKDYTDIVGDHPQNMQATTLAFNAFALTGEKKYKDWVLEYVDAWAARAAANNNILPSNIGLDGTIGGETDGKWYGGAYGWGFSVIVPQTGEIAHRPRTAAGWFGFRSAFLLTGEDKYLDVWRKQIDAINANRKMENGRWVYPRMHGDQGWYAWTPEPYREKADELYALSMRADDRQRAGRDAWLDFLDGKNPDYPERALQSDLARIRQRIAAMRLDPTTPDTRLSDDPMQFNPASVQSLVALTLGGVHPGIGGSPLLARVRYFDPEQRRPGLPEDIAALVERLTVDEATLTLVNINQLSPRTLLLQGGAYGEHHITAVATAGQELAVSAPHLRVTLAPGCGGKFTLRFQRHKLQPTLAFPWR